MSDVRIRPLADYEELSACVELQKKTWGPTFDDIVSAALMLVGQKIGGVAAGAFTNDTLVGIVYGLTGIRGDERVHWSHMLAVEPSHQGRGIGRCLKLYQRERTLRIGARTMYWTFDPLEARNAHFNINGLKASIDDYVLDMYGSGETSPLHRGIGTDRLVVRWDLESAGDELSEEIAQLTWDGDAAVAALSADRSSGPATVELTDDTPHVEIPIAIQSLKASDPEEALRWRTATRAAFTDYFSRGYRVRSFGRASDSGKPVYLLERSENASS